MYDIVIAPAKTGKLSKSKKAVIKTDQTNNGSLRMDIPLDRILYTVTIKLIAPAIEETPAKCNANILQSTANPE